MERKIKNFCTAVILAAIVSVPVSAPNQARADDTPCGQIQTACGEAGFTRDVPGGKDLMTKCFNPILQGQTITGVKVDPDTVKKCKAQQNTKPSKKKRWG